LLTRHPRHLFAGIAEVSLDPVNDTGIRLCENGAVVNLTILTLTDNQTKNIKSGTGLLGLRKVVNFIG